MTTDARPLNEPDRHEGDPAWEMFDLLPVGVVLIDRHYTVLFWNQCIARWTGIDCEEIVGSDLRTRFPHLAGPVYTSRIDQVFEGGPAAVFSSQFHPHFIPAPLENGELLAEHASVIPFDLHGTRLGMIVIEDIHDLTSQVRLYRATRELANAEIEERKRAQEALHAANTKLNLLSSITRHDILNQMTAVEGYLFLMESSLAQDAAQHEYVEKIKFRMSVIARFLKVTRDYEQMGVQSPAWCNVPEIAQRAARDIFPGSVRFENELPGLEVCADPLFEKVIFNIFENAKFHGEHVTEIRIGFVHDAGPGLIFIEDNGVGVPAGQKERIFLKGVGTRTGLGLYLSQEILSLTGLELRETGTPGRGARFEILIPPAMFKVREQPGSPPPF